MNKISKSSTFLLLVLFVIAHPAFGQSSGLLSPEEALWLESRNNTIVVYPEKNNPPFSYSSAGGNIQGLSIDFIELIAEKVGAKILYLLPQSRSQILSDFTGGKGDVIAGLMETNDRGSSFIFTDSYVTVPTVIVARKDAPIQGSLTFNDFNGKRVSVMADSALEEYSRQNYPRVILETVTDDEVSLQQVILGEAEAAALDIASLSFYLSKQVLSSVKIVGSTGLDYEPAFALRATDTTLQKILEKGMSQVSTSDRALLTEKWVTIPAAAIEKRSFADSLTGDLDGTTLLVLILLALFIGSIVMFKHRSLILTTGNFGKDETLNELKKEVSHLESTNDTLLEEMKIIKEEEDKIQEKLDSLGK